MNRVVYIYGKKEKTKNNPGPQWHYRDDQYVFVPEKKEERPIYRPVQYADA